MFSLHILLNFYVELITLIMENVFIHSKPVKSVKIDATRVAPVEMFIFYGSYFHAQNFRKKSTGHKHRVFVTL